MIIDCGTCAHSPSRGSSLGQSNADGRSHDDSSGAAACGDCVVSVLLGPPDAPAAVPEIADEHARALGVLADSGLIPPLRLVRSPRQRSA